MVLGGSLGVGIIDDLLTALLCTFVDLIVASLFVCLCPLSVVVWNDETIWVLEPAMRAVVNSVILLRLVNGDSECDSEDDVNGVVALDDSTDVWTWPVLVVGLDVINVVACVSITDDEPVDIVEKKRVANGVGEDVVVRFVVAVVMDLTAVVGVMASEI